MHVITASNVDQALYDGLWWLHLTGVKKDSRNGPVISSPCPVVTVYTNPTNRVIQSPLRDANPYFHFFESLWMLAGREDVAFPASFAKQITEYSDDGETLNGAYGNRWRYDFHIDQLDFIVDELTTTPTSRRAVLSMWNAEHDTYSVLAGSKDVPCNTHVYFSISPGSKLEMTVMCRSNDIVWGAYGANVVHFSMLQEYVAARIGVEVGTYRQFSNDFHIYPENAVVKRLHDEKGAPRAQTSHYYRPSQKLIHPGEETSWYEDLHLLLSEWELTEEKDFKTEFFSSVAYPLMRSHVAYKFGDMSAASDYAVWCRATDWSMAALDWLVRRGKNAQSR